MNLLNKLKKGLQDKKYKNNNNMFNLRSYAQTVENSKNNNLTID